MVTMHNAKRMSRLAAVGGVTGALALGAFGLAVSAHENNGLLAEPTTQTPGATATETPGATQTQTPGGSSTSTSSPHAPDATEVPGVTSGGAGGTVPGAGGYVPGSGR